MQPKTHGLLIERLLESPSLSMAHPYQKRGRGPPICHKPYQHLVRPRWASVKRKRQASAKSAVSVLSFSCLLYLCVLQTVKFRKQAKQISAKSAVFACYMFISLHSKSLRSRSLCSAEVVLGGKSVSKYTLNAISVVCQPKEFCANLPFPLSGEYLQALFF